jgi:hypothetical protein
MVCFTARQIECWLTPVVTEPLLTSCWATANPKSAITLLIGDIQYAVCCIMHSTSSASCCRVSFHRVVPHLERLRLIFAIPKDRFRRQKSQLTWHNN